MKVQVVFLLVICSFIMADNSQAQVYCGRRLAQVLRAICTRDFQAKRSGYNPVPFGLSPWKVEQDFWPWLAPAKAQGLNGARNKRPVVSECCDKPCTIEELLTYC